MSDLWIVAWFGVALIIGDVAAVWIGHSYFHMDRPALAAIMLNLIATMVVPIVVIVWLTTK